MKYLFLAFMLLIIGCNSVIGLNQKSEMAYIFSVPLTQTKSCSGESLIIVGVRQSGRAAVELHMHGIYVPEGKNYIYYNKVSESFQNGKCETLQEILVRHSEIVFSKLERLPSGEELEITVKGGKSYNLVLQNGNVVVREVEI